MFKINTKGLLKLFSEKRQVEDKIISLDASIEKIESESELIYSRISEEELEKLNNVDQLYDELGIKSISQSWEEWFEEDNFELYPGFEHHYDDVYLSESTSYKQRLALYLKIERIVRAKILREKLVKIRRRLVKKIRCINQLDKRKILNRIGLRKVRQLFATNKDEEEIFNLKEEEVDLQLEKLKILFYEKTRMAAT